MLPIEAARVSLLGLSVGDAFGSMLDRFGSELALRCQAINLDTAPVAMDR